MQFFLAPVVREFTPFSTTYVELSDAARCVTRRSYRSSACVAPLLPPALRRIVHRFRVCRYRYYNLSFSIDSIAAFFITLRAFRYFRLQRNLWILRTAIERSIQAWHSTAQHSTAQHSTAQHSTAQHSTAQHSTMLCNAMRCDAMLCYAMLCYAMPCYAMLCYAMLCYAMLSI
jgi:hypothetical protein